MIDTLPIQFSARLWMIACALLFGSALPATENATMLVVGHSEASNSNGVSERPAQPAMHVLHTKTKTRFGLFGEKRSAPAPTLFVFATDVDQMDQQRIYSETGRQLARHGWIYVTLDLPCHGRDRRAGEPDYLSGWAHRVKTGQDLTKDFLERCTDVLDFLISQGISDPARIAASGTSRGGFCALQFAAADPRVRAVACISPVTNLLALREFEGVAEESAGDWCVGRQVDRLSDRAVWLSIGDNDQRVGTDDCIHFGRKLAVAARRQRRGSGTAPIELVVAASRGHQAIAGGYCRAAEFIRKHCYASQNGDRE